MKIILAKPDSDPRNNPAFRRWFGKSKVVDSTGRPKVCYHGTRADLDRFVTHKREFKKLEYRRMPDGSQTITGIRHDGSRVKSGSINSFKSAKGTLWIWFGPGVPERLDEHGVSLAADENEVKHFLSDYLNPAFPVSRRIEEGHKAFFFSESSDYAHVFVNYHGDSKEEDHKGVIYPAYLRIENPVLPIKEHWLKLLPFYKRGVQALPSVRSGEASFDAILNRMHRDFLLGGWMSKETIPGFIDYAKSRGFDGYMNREGALSGLMGIPVDEADEHRSTTWCVFSGRQVKSIYSQEFKEGFSITSAVSSLFLRKYGRNTFSLSPQQEGEVHHLTLLLNGRSVGSSEMWREFRDHSTVYLNYFGLERRFRSKGYGNPLILLVLKYVSKSFPGAKLLTADVMSKAMANVLTGALGKPLRQANDMKEFSSFEDAYKTLPNTSPEDDDGNLVGGYRVFMEWKIGR